MIGIIPTPEKITEKEGFFSLADVKVVIPLNIDSRVRRAAVILAKEITEKTGRISPVTCKKSTISAIVLNCGNDNDEGYNLTIAENAVSLESKGAAGAFYGIQTLRQLVKLYGDKIPCCEICDTPDFKIRGFYHDVTRGRVNTLGHLKKIVDFLSFYKINSLQLYIEDAFMFKEFEGILSAGEALTPAEITELDDYCYNNFIDLVPSLSTFGHLFTLLQSEKYNCLCELKDYEMSTHYWMEKQWHHTIDVYNPLSIEVIGSMILQYMSLFRSEYFNICCDETMDLCCGKNKGADKDEAYFHHLKKLVDLVEGNGKKVMMWGDICMGCADKMKENVSENVTILNWCYHKTVPEWLGRFAYDKGFKWVACPGVDSWSRFIENIDEAEGNITEFAKWAKKYNAEGILNTNWGDFGHECHFNCNLFGAVLGAQKSWNEGAEINGEFKKLCGRLLYGEEDMYDLVYNLGRAETNVYHFTSVMWYSENIINGMVTPLKIREDGTGNDEDLISGMKMCEEALIKLNAVKEKNERIKDVILAAEAIILMSRQKLRIRGYREDEMLTADCGEFIKKYEAAWLREDKPSQLWRISQFIRDMCAVKTGRGKEVKA